MASRYNLGQIENALNAMVGKPDSASRAMDYLAQRGFDNTELNGQDGYRKTSGLTQYDTWAGFEDEDGHYVKLTYTMVRNPAKGANAFKAGKLRGVYCEGYENDVNASRRIRKRSIKAGYQSFGNSGNPWKDIEALKDSYIKQWWRDYDGDPNTSWDNIFDNVLAEFESYADDEASGFILDKYNSGDIGDGDMRHEFDSFIMFLDMNDYDF